MSDTFGETVTSVFTGREDIPEKLHTACEKCIASAHAKYDGFTDDTGRHHKDGFAVGCPFIPPSEEFYPEKIKKLLSPADWSDLNNLKSALLWAEANLRDPDSGRPWRAWPHQRGPLLCCSPRKVYRFGRRTGKTTILAVEILWYIFTSCGGQLKDGKKIRKNLKVLLLAPQKTHIDNIFDRMRAFISLSPQLAGCIERKKRGSPQLITLITDGADIGGGNQVAGYASGDSSGNKGLSARGQDADLVVLDEGAYVSKAVVKQVIAPILYTRGTTRFIISSTPSGITGDYFETTCLQRPDFSEFYVPATERPDWAEQEEQVRRDVSGQEEWDTEVMAKFSPAGVGVYREDLVKFAQDKYEYGDRRVNPNFVYTMGVDWNKEHGTEIVIVATMRISPHITYVVWAENISKKDFTTPSGIGRVVELNRMWKPAWIYVDAGGGDGGAMLRHHGREMVKKNIIDARLMNIVKSYDFGSKLEVREHNGISRKTPSKPFMVEHSVRKFELGEIKYPRSDLMITRQLNNYVVLRRNSGVPVYGIKESKWGDHRLDAMNLALVALRLEFTSFYNEGITPLGSPIAFVPRTGMPEPPPPRVILPAAAGFGPTPSGRGWVSPGPRRRQGVVRYWGTEPSEAEVERRSPSRRISRRSPKFGR